MSAATLRKTLSNIVKVSGIALTLMMFQSKADQKTASDNLRTFTNVLFATMKDSQRLGKSGCYKTLSPFIKQAFDIPYMIRETMGSSWTQLTPAQKRTIGRAIERYNSAVYSTRFDSITDAQFEITSEQKGEKGTTVFARINTQGTSIRVNFLMSQTNRSWQIRDVYYMDGAISELRARQDDFDSILRREGFENLVLDLQKKSESMVGAIESI